MTLRGTCVQLRDYSYKDFEDYLEMFSDERISFFDFQSQIDYDLAKQELHSKIESNKVNNNSFFYYAVESVEKEKLIGELSVSYIDPEQTIALIGFAVNPAFWRNGYATDMIKTYINFHFNNSGTRVFCSTFSENVACNELLNKIGFKKEGELRQSVWSKDKIWNETFYGIMNFEWKIQ